MISQYRIRKRQFAQRDDRFVSNLRLLDFGCGVGRVMEACREIGVKHVDGCDISREMIEHAKASDYLQGSQFFLSSGFDAGAAPENHYDIAYSFLCLHHIPMRQTRIAILEALCKSLKPGGMIFAELRVFPGATASRIPVNHAHWTENRPARDTNSAADVWVTRDSLGELVEDFRLFFDDIGVQEFDLKQDLYEYKADEIYQLGYNELFVMASKGAELRDNMQAPT
nr:class I SAM-dependent methyltransferase [Rhodopirellula sp. JC639]